MKLIVIFAPVSLQGKKCNLLIPYDNKMHAFLCWGSVIRSKINYVFRTIYELYMKNIFLKVPPKRLLYGIIKYNFSFYMYTSSLSLFPGRAFIYVWSVYFLLLALGISFPCSRMVFSDKTHKLCITTSSAARRVNHKNVVCLGCSVCLCWYVCILMSNPVLH